MQQRHLLSLRHGVVDEDETSVKYSILDQYLANEYPCSSVSVICGNFNSSCDMTYQLQLNLESSLDASDEEQCYMVSMESVQKLFCGGACKASPTESPTEAPTLEPSVVPTNDPTADPTSDPTRDPSQDPSTEPTLEPTLNPSNHPTSDPTADPTADPSVDPTVDPTLKPTQRLPEPPQKTHKSQKSSTREFDEEP